MPSESVDKLVLNLLLCIHHKIHKDCMLRLHEELNRAYLQVCGQHFYMGEGFQDYSRIQDSYLTLEAPTKMHLKMASA